MKFTYQKPLEAKLSTSKHLKTTTGVIVAAFVITFIFFVSFSAIFHLKTSKARERINSINSNNSVSYLKTSEKLHPWVLKRQIQFNNISMGTTILGSGEFGIVRMGKVVDGQCRRWDVAIKGICYFYKKKTFCYIYKTRFHIKYVLLNNKIGSLIGSWVK